MRSSFAHAQSTRLSLNRLSRFYELRHVVYGFLGRGHRVAEGLRQATCRATEDRTTGVLPSGNARSAYIHIPFCKRRQAMHDSFSISGAYLLVVDELKPLFPSVQKVPLL